MDEYHDGRYPDYDFRERNEQHPDVHPNDLPHTFDSDSDNEVNPNDNAVVEGGSNVRNEA